MAATEPDGEAAQRNSPDGPAAAGSAWKLTLPCTKQQAEALADAEIDGAVLVATEEDEAAGRWRLDAYFDGEPDAETLAAVRSLAPGDNAEPQPLADQDWTVLSQAGLEPVRAGRFVVHTNAYPADAPPDGRAFLIEAGQAFGTGHHETTAGCLAMLDALAERRFGNIADLGTGTGLLAFAARHLWPAARVLATDIDPVAIAVTRENMAANAVAGVDLLVADGARDAAIAERAPFDLIIANILAGPLVAMAAEVAAIAAPGASVVLAGLLERQAEAVEAAYRAAGCTPEAREVRGDWAILRLTAGGDVASPLDPRPASELGDWASDGR